MKIFSIVFFKIFGWNKNGDIGGIKKCVMIAAPHTSNWDLPMTLMLAFLFDLKVYWMGKKSIFRFPFGSIMKWLGGVPVDRSKSNNLVDDSIELFRKNENMILIVPPEGTRGRTKYWKTGFYYIAEGAGVPVLPGYVDYGRKIGGFGKLFNPSGDIEADIDSIKKFYSGITGKHPDKYNDNAVVSVIEEKVS